VHGVGATLYYDGANRIAIMGCMHEFVLSGAPMKREWGIRTLDLAKRLLDHGVHPPTVYFPLLVDEAGAADGRGQAAARARVTQVTTVLPVELPMGEVTLRAGEEHAMMRPCGRGGAPIAARRSGPRLWL
jgi:hypothetical protein